MHVAAYVYVLLARNELVREAIYFYITGEINAPRRLTALTKEMNKCSTNALVICI